MLPLTYPLPRKGDTLYITSIGGTLLGPLTYGHFDRGRSHFVTEGSLCKELQGRRVRLKDRNHRNASRPGDQSRG